jgi:hypothetical protein
MWMGTLLWWEVNGLPDVVCVYVSVCGWLTAGVV